MNVYYRLTVSKIRSKCVQGQTRASKIRVKLAAYKAAGNVYIVTAPLVANVGCSYTNVWLHLLHTKSMHFNVNKWQCIMSFCKSSQKLPKHMLMLSFTRLLQRDHLVFLLCALFSCPYSIDAFAGLRCFLGRPFPVTSRY